MTDNIFQNQTNIEKSREVSEPLSEIKELITTCAIGQQTYQEFKERTEKSLRSEVITPHEKNYLNLLLAHIEKILHTENEITKNELLKEFEELNLKSPQQIGQELEKETFQKGTPKIDATSQKYTRPLIVKQGGSAPLDRLQTYEQDPLNPNQRRPRRYKVVEHDQETGVTKTYYINYFRHDLTNWKKGEGHWYQIGQLPTDKKQELPVGAQILEITDQDVEKIARLEIKKMLDNPRVKELKETPIYAELLNELLFQARIQEGEKEQENIVQETIAQVTEERKTETGKKVIKKEPIMMTTLQTLNPTFLQKLKTPEQYKEELVLPQIPNTLSVSEKIPSTTISLIGISLVEFAKEYQQPPEQTNERYQGYLREKEEIAHMTLILEELAKNAIEYVEKIQPQTSKQGITSSQLLYEEMPYEIEEEKALIFRDNLAFLKEYKREYLQLTN